MSDPFNPYVEWLGLPAERTEPNHYQLLGLADFESDAARIAIAADRAMSRVRSFRPGPNAKAWSKLLDELLLAKGRLLDPERKTEYDAELQESRPPAAAAPAAASKSDAQPSDPRFPPGMGPNDKPAAPQANEAAQSPTPNVAPNPSPAPMAVPIAPLSNVPPTAWPASMLHPVAHSASQSAPSSAAQPQSVPQQPATLAQGSYGAPQATPIYPQPYGGPQQPYGQPPYGQPQFAQPYGQPPYVAPGYASPQPQYGQAGYGQPQYAAPAYGMTSPPTPPPAEPPVSNPYGGFGAFQPPPSSGGGSHFGPVAHSSYALGDANPSTSAPLDPMAPVALPTSLPVADEGKTPRVVGFAAAQQGPPSAIPRGKAVSPATSSGSAGATTSAPLASSIAEAKKGTPTLPAAPVSLPVTPTLKANSVESALAAARNEKSKTDQMLFYGSAAAIVVMIGAIAFAIVNANQGSTNVAQQTDGIEVNPEPAAPPAKPSNPTPPAPAPAKPVTPPVDRPRNEPINPKRPPKTPTKPAPAEVKPPMPLPPSPMSPAPATPAPTTPAPKPPEPMPKPPEPTTTTPVPTPPKPPEPKPPEPMPEVKLTPEELQTLSKSMTAAKEALQERAFEETEKQLAIATKLARSPEQQAKLNRLTVVKEYVKQFDRSLKTLMADENFDAGAELTIGSSTRVVVVERNPSNIVIRINGVNKSYALNTLPDGLAMALIDKRLDPNDPVSKLVKASYLAVAKIPTEVNQAKARELFEEAKAQGEDIADLPLVMTDTYDFKE